MSLRGLRSKLRQSVFSFKSRCIIKAFKDADRHGRKRPCDDRGISLSHFLSLCPDSTPAGFANRF